LAVLAVLWVILEQRRSSPAVETLPAAESNARRNTLLSVGNRHRGICRPKPHRGIRSLRRRRGCAASLLPRAIPTETRAWYTLACISTYRIPRIAPPPVRCDYPKPNRERSFGNSGRGFRERSRFDHSSLRPPAGNSHDYETRLPQCRSIETSRSRRRGTVERYLLRVIGLRPFRCLNCDVRFYSFARFDDETALNDDAT
jgi:hypothetical protein